MKNKIILFSKKILKALKVFISRVLADGGIIEAKNYVNSVLKTVTDASLVLIPSAYKSGVLYSILPEDGTGDFTFSRPSGATRVNSQGLIEEVSLLGDELVTNGTFDTDTDWTENGTTPYMTIANGYLNSNNTVAGNWFAENISQNIAFVNGKQYKVSATIRNISGESSVRITQGANVIISTAITSEWVEYKTIYTANADNNSIRLFVNGSIGQFEIDNISIVEYSEEGIPRIDYTDGTPVLLTEPQSTNLVIDSVIGNLIGVTDFTNKVISPDGLVNATRMKPDTPTARFQEIVLAGTYATNTILTYSWYRKRISTPLITSFIGDLDTEQFNVNLVINNANEQIQSDINGFDKFKVTVQIVDGSLESIFRAYFGDIVGVGNLSIAYFGHQLEQLPYASSYIPTEGTTATRLAEAVTDGGDVNSINSEEGVLYFEVASLNTKGSLEPISLTDGTNNNRILFYYSSTANRISLSFKVSAAVIFTFNLIIQDVTEINKFAFKYKSGDFALWVNGVQEATDNSVASFPPNTLSNISFSDQSGNIFEGKVKQIQVYKTALTDAELIELTTI